MKQQTTGKKIRVITIRRVNSVFDDGVNSTNRNIHISAMENTMLPIEFRKGKI